MGENEGAVRLEITDGTAGKASLCLGQYFERLIAIELLCFRNEGYCQEKQCQNIRAHWAISA